MNFNSIFKLRKIILRILILGIIITFYGVVIERYWIINSEYEIKVKNLPKDFDGLRILQISDLHYGFLMPEFWISYIIDKANSSGADIIVGTGDYVKRKKTTDEIHVAWKHLARLTAKQGVCLVLGNHDHWANTETSISYLEKSGYSVRHRAKKIKRNDSEIYIAGGGDFYEDEDGLDIALKNIPKDKFKIALVHNPDSADILRKEKINLFISGHTHGGQVVIPILNYSPVLPVKNKKYNFGVKYNSEGVPVFISRGIGWSILPIRLFCRPELAVVVLRGG